MRDDNDTIVDLGNEDRAVHGVGVIDYIIDDTALDLDAEQSRIVSICVDVFSLNTQAGSSIA